MGVRGRGRLLKREREREKDDESMRIGKERKSPSKTDVPKLYAYNECEHSVLTFIAASSPLFSSGFHVGYHVLFAFKKSSAAYKRGFDNYRKNYLTWNTLSKLEHPESHS